MMFPFIVLRLNFLGFDKGVIPERQQSFTSIVILIPTDLDFSRAVYIPLSVYSGNIALLVQNHVRLWGKLKWNPAPHGRDKQ